MGLFKILWNIKNLNQKGNPKYNAYEEDIAVLNLYFGDSTVFGNYLSVNICLHIESHVWSMIIYVAHAIL